MLLSFGNWVGITSAAAAQGAVLVTPEHFDVARLVDVIVGTPSLRVLVVHGIPPNSLRLAAALRPAAQMQGRPHRNQGRWALADGRAIGDIAAARQVAEQLRKKLDFMPVVVQR